MATEFCQKCKQSHPGRACDYDERGDCAETLEDSDIQQAKEQAGGPARPGTKSSKRG